MELFVSILAATLGIPPRRRETTTQHNLRPSLPVQKRKQLFSFSLLINRNRCNDKNLRLYSLGRSVAPTQEWKKSATPTLDDRVSNFPSFVEAFAIRREKF